jgi:hypothetical protein
MGNIMGHDALRQPEQSIVSNSFRFATSVWLTSVVLSPFMFFLLSGTMDPEKLHIEFLGLKLFIEYSLYFGPLFSLPCWTLFFFAVKLINKQSISLTKKKVLISLIGVVLTYLLFYFLFFNDSLVQRLGFDMRLPTAYSLTILIGTVLYNLKTDNLLRN